MINRAFNQITLIKLTRLDALHSFFINVSML